MGLKKGNKIEEVDVTPAEIIRVVQVPGEPDSIADADEIGSDPFCVISVWMQNTNYTENSLVCIKAWGVNGNGYAREDYGIVKFNVSQEEAKNWYIGRTFRAGAVDHGNSRKAPEHSGTGSKGPI